MKISKILKLAITISMLTVTLVGCGSEKEEPKPAVKTYIEAKKDEYMSMKKKYRAEFDIKDKNGNEAKVGVLMEKAERTSDRSVGAEAEDVILVTYEYEILEADAPILISAGFFKAKNEKGEKLNLYPGYQDYNAKEISKGEKCKAQMVFSSDEKVEGLELEFVNPNEREKPLGVWELEIQKRNYITG